MGSSQRGQRIFSGDVGSEIRWWGREGERRRVSLRSSRPRMKRVRPEAARRRERRTSEGRPWRRLTWEKRITKVDAYMREPRPAKMRPTRRVAAGPGDDRFLERGWRMLGVIGRGLWG